MLMSFGTLAAQASPPGYGADRPPIPYAYASVTRQHHLMEYKPTPQEYQKLLNVLHIDDRSFERETRNGKSLAEIANRQNASVRKVTKLVTSQMKDHIEQSKRDHRITEDQARYLKDHVQEYAKNAVNRKSVSLDHYPTHHRFEW